MTPPLFLLPDGELESTTAHVRLTGAEGHHAVRVRRITPGETVEVTDGRGVRARCIVGAVGKDSAELDVQWVRAEPAPEPRLVVVQALPKGERGELAVELLTEIGADEIVPWGASRCVSRWRGPRGDKSRERWVATAREAAKQSRRSHLPSVAPLATTAGVCAILRAADAALILHEEAATSLATVRLPAEGTVVLVVGPEGGISDAELAAFTGEGAEPVRLGPTILRTSTAGPAACALVLGRTSRWGGVPVNDG